MSVERILVEVERVDSPGTYRISKKLRANDRGLEIAFIARNKLRRKEAKRKKANPRYRERKVRIVYAEMNRRGRVIKRYTIKQYRNKVEYPFDGSPKDGPARRRAYDIAAVKHGGRHTSGDRQTKYTAGGNVSDHWVGVTTSAADDYGWKYWQLSGRRSQARAATELRKMRGVKQVYDEPHGTGPHIHVATYV